jgi:hypothetical protein
LIGLDVGVECFVVGLIDEVGFASSVMAECGKEPSKALASVVEVWRCVVGCHEFAAKRLDGLA